MTQAIPHELTGRPSVVAEMGSRLHQLASRVESIADHLDGFRLTEHWGSSAGWAFDSRVKGLVPDLRLVVGRYRRAGALLLEFALRLEQCQFLVQEALGDKALAEARIELIDDEVSGLVSGNPAREQELMDRRRALVLQLNDAEARHRLATSSFRGLDGVTASELYELSVGDLTDPWHYDALHGLESLAGGVAAGASMAALVPPLTPVAGPLAGGATATQIGTSAVIRLVYDEGSWKKIGTDAATNSIGRVGQAVGDVARAGVRTVNGRPLTLKERVRDGVTSHVNKSIVSTRTLPPPPPPITQSNVAARIEKELPQDEAHLLREIADDWEHVKDSDTMSKSLLGGSVGLRVTHHVNQRRQQWGIGKSWLVDEEEKQRGTATSAERGVVR